MAKMTRFDYWFEDYMADEPMSEEIYNTVRRIAKAAYNSAAEYESKMWYNAIAYGEQFDEEQDNG